MSDQGANIEKLLERYVTDDLTDSDRELVEQYLTGSGPDAARARADLKYEHLLIKAMELPMAEVGIADAVLQRVFERPLPESRKNFRPDVALTALREAERSGRIGQEKSQFWTWRAQRMATMAACFLVFVSAMWFTAAMNRTDPLAPKQNPQSPLLSTTVASVSYLEDVPEAVEDIPAFDANLKSVSVLAGDDIQTDERQAALVKMRGGGTVFVKPLSRVQVVRDAKGRKLGLRVLEGALVYDFSATNGAVFVESGGGQRGRLKGAGQITVASRSIGGIERPSMSASLGQILLVRVKDKSWAIFSSSAGNVQIRSGQLGVVSGEDVLTVADTKKKRAGILNPKKWSLDKIIADADKPMLQVAQRLIKREDVVQEALRVFEFELIDMIVASYIIDVELKRLNCQPNQTEHAEALRFINTNDLMQILPLRSSDAVRVRAQHLAGLMAIDRAQRARSKRKGKIESIPQLRQRIWGQLHNRLRVDRKIEDDQVAFRIHYRGQVREVARAETWIRLKQFIRRSELARLVQKLSEKTILDIWLENTNLDWPELPDSQNFPLVALAQMAGLTRVQLLDRQRIEGLIVRNTRAPKSSEVERFMKEKVTKRRRLYFDHYFFPLTDPFHGGLFSKKRRTETHKQAMNLVAKLRAGEEIKPEDTQVAVPNFTSTLWQSGTAEGPRPWWNELYGRNFTLAVMNLSVGQVSNPILSGEGFHVVRLTQEGEDKSDPRSHKSYAQMIYRFELARQMFEKQVAEKTKLLCPLEDILK